jgi:alpha-glucosidase
VAEVGGADSDREMKLFTAEGRRLHSAYGFDFLYAPRLTARRGRRAVREMARARTESAGRAGRSRTTMRLARISRWVAPEQARAFAG